MGWGEKLKKGLEKVENLYIDNEQDIKAKIGDLGNKAEDLADETVSAAKEFGKKAMGLAKKGKEFADEVEKDFASNAPDKVEPQEPQKPTP